MRRALCVGIDDYPLQDADLRGAVNDARGWARVLVELAGFDEGEVTVLTDRKATRAAVLGGIERLVDGLGPGDVGVFTYAGHGTYVAGEEGGDEVYDEAICPWDTRDEVILDDELRVLLDTVPTGATVAVVLDSCYSGTATRDLPGGEEPGTRRPRTLPPARIGRPEIDVLRARKRPSPRTERSMTEILLTGCRDDEESADDLIDGVWGGAMSTFALRQIRAARGRISWQRLHARVRADLALAGYSQVPQLEGRARLKRRRAFTPVPS
ncbi:MAG: caspase domain-containing protein [Acidimicrobiia bacterium]